MTVTEGRIRPIRLIGGFVLLCIIWGSTWLAMKEGLATVPPFMSATIRFYVAIALLVALLYRQRQTMPRDREFLRLILETGILIYALPFALIYWGQSQIPSGLSSVLFATFPFFVAIAGRFRIQGEKISIIRSTGIIVGFAGVIQVFWAELSANDELSPLGMLAIVASAAMQAYALISIRLRGRDIHPVSLTLGGMIVGVAFLSAMTIAFESSSEPTFDVTAIVSIGYLAAFGTVTSFITYFWLVKHVDPVILALTAFITPLVALSLGSIVRGEYVHTDLVLGAGLVLCGVLLANFMGLRTLLSKKLPPSV